MKAVWYDRQGPAREVLNYGDMPTPEAGRGEVRIKLKASGVNPSDTYRRSGTNGPMEYARVIANSDGAGIVDQIGIQAPSVSRSATESGSTTASATAAPLAPRLNTSRSTKTWLRRCRTMCRSRPAQRSACPA